MNDHTLEKLEFDSVRRALVACCGTGLGKGLADSLKPSTRTQLVRQWLEQVRDLAAVVEEHGLPPMGGIHDIRESVRAAAFPAPLEPDTLADIAGTLQATANLTAWFAALEEAAPALQSLSRRVTDLSSIAEVIYGSISPRGDVLDVASPRLSNIRRTMDEARRRARAVFDRILKQPSLTRFLQYGGATFHNDRMVLPLKAEHRGRIAGIIHRSSDSGATLFVEPSESVELNNTLVRLGEDERQEITRILRVLSQHVKANTDAILSCMQATAVVDLISAKYRYMKKRKCVVPFVGDDRVLDLVEARHPVLTEVFENEAAEGGPRREVVPIDVRLGDDFDVLVLTGPNTGGKTVALKTVGLMALMAQCGIPIPAGEGSRLPVYDKIFIDVGDEQSLQQSLSTFSSHLSTLLGVLKSSNERTLVLIDELGAGTDPDEGAAIGRAIIAELLNLNSSAMITTHLSALKAVAYTADRVDNASVEFDAETLKPTYHLRMGEPGNSNALIIAKRLGMPARLVKLARSHLDDRTRALNKAIAGTLQSRREAERARKDARDAALEAQRRQEESQREAEELRRSHEAFQRWTDWVNRLRPGDEVFVKSLKREARVVRMQMQNQKALVSTGALDIEVPIGDITIPDQDAA